MARAPLRERWKLDVALATCEEFPELQEDDRPLLSRLERIGLSAAPKVWTDPAVNWAEIGTVVLRSTWDYHRQRPAFLRWIRHVASVSQLRNTPRTLRWNTHKSYLFDLERSGIPIVPTRLLGRNDRSKLRGTLRREGWEAFVLKPAVSANAFRTARFGRSELPAAETHLDGILRDGPALLQPYYPSVEGVRERSLLFLGGRFSHAVRKPSVLARGGRSSRAELVEATPAQRALARRVLRAAPEASLYARIDLVEDPEGRWRLMEAELTEPTLFLAWSPGAVDRFARVIARAAREPARPRVSQPFSRKARSLRA